MIQEEFNDLEATIDKLVDLAVSKPESSIPTNLDEAAEEYAKLHKNSLGYVSMEHFEGFKAGAKWMAGQGVTGEGEIMKDSYNVLVANAKMPQLSKDFKFGEEVIVQVRKK